MSAGQLGELQRAERRELRRLEHDGVAGGERGPDLPDRHHERVVPRARSTRPRRAGRGGASTCSPVRYSPAACPRGSGRAPAKKRRLSAANQISSPIGRRSACRRCATRPAPARRRAPRCASANLRSIAARSCGVVCRPLGERGLRGARRRRRRRRRRCDGTSAIGSPVAGSTTGSVRAAAGGHPLPADEVGAWSLSSAMSRCSPPARSVARREQGNPLPNLRPQTWNPLRHATKPANVGPIFGGDRSRDVRGGCMATVVADHRPGRRGREQGPQSRGAGPGVGDGRRRRVDGAGLQPRRDRWAS